MPRQLGGRQRMQVRNVQRTQSKARVDRGMNCDGGLGNRSKPKANFMAISQELAADR